MKKNTKRVIKYLIEFLIVAFGVFLGVYASEIQSKKKIKIEKENSISYIIEELESNKKRLEESIKYHQSIKTEIDSIAKTLDEKDLFTTYIGNKSFRHNEIKGWNGVQVANLDITAFEAAKISGIMKEYDIKFIQNISRLYKHQKTYSELGNKVLTKMINLNSSTKVVDMFSSIELMTSDLLNYEKSLLEAIRKIKTK
jgi:tRNA nucleotidyltransferase (CCA-adding enzyme)